MKQDREVRLEYLMPGAIDSVMKTCSTLFLPPGTIEWHGLHNTDGLDAVKAHAFCSAAAEEGGGQARLAARIFQGERIPGKCFRKRNRYRLTTRFSSVRADKISEPQGGILPEAPLTKGSAFLLKDASRKYRLSSWAC